jgi:hypothetical protein
MPLSDNDIKSELSYAYLHAVASRCGCACEVAGRHSDGMGVDARVHVKGLFGPDSMSRFTVEIQLKATSDQPAVQGERIPFWLKAKNYDELRASDVANPQLLVALFLPADPSEWLSWSEEGLIARRCAYWQSLYGAPPGSPSGQTVYLPKGQVLSVEAFRVLLARLARKERLPYVV